MFLGKLEFLAHTTLIFRLCEICECQLHACWLRQTQKRIHEHSVSGQRGDVDVFVMVLLQEVARRKRGADTSSVNKGWLLNIKLLSGKDLIAKDTIAEGTYGTRFTESSDPYVVFKVGNATAKSATIQRTLNPTWNEEISLPVSTSSYLGPVCMVALACTHSSLHADDCLVVTKNALQACNSCI
jgi:Ca2+-dependent lipid-binding protein